MIIQSTSEIAASPERVYRLIADYRTGHPRILPPQHFGNMVVEKGGYGAGTIVSFDMRVLGSVQRSRAHISEPLPGRCLIESIRDKDIVTTFVVEPIAQDRCRVTISTGMRTRGGLLGMIERRFIRWFLNRVYRAELLQLDRVASSSEDLSTARQFATANA